MRIATIVACGLLGGCSVVNTDNGTGDTDALPDCGSTPPAFEGDVTVTDKGTVDFRGTPKRALQIAGVVTDADGDLFHYTTQVWYDTTKDGTFKQAQPQVTVPVALGDPNVGADTGGPCRFDRATAGAVIPMGEGDVPMGEEVEFGIVISDAAGNPTDGATPRIVTFTTPAE